jgi:PST family polysaccharide transporter
VKQLEVFDAVSETAGLRRELRERSVRGALYLGAGSGGDFLLRIVSTAVLARLLIPEHFGLIGMVTAVTGIAGQFSQLGLSTVTIQRRDIDHYQVSNLFWINVAFATTLFALFCALAPLVAAFYRDPRLVPITIAVSSAFLCGGVTVQHEALLARQMKQPRSMAVRLASSGLSAVLAVGLALKGLGYWALVWQEIARALLTAAGMWIVCPWRPALPNRAGSLRGLLRFGGDLTLTQLSYAIISNVDRLVIGRLFGAGPLGIFRQAQQLIMAPLDQLNAPIGSVSQPGLSALQDDPARYRRYYQKIVFVIGLATMPIAVFAGAYADEIVLLLLGPNWGAAAPFFRIFAAAAFIRPVLGTAGTVLITCGHSGRLLAVTVLSQITLFALIFAGISRGPEGVAVAHLLTPWLLLLPVLHYSFQGSPVNLKTFFTAIRTPVAASMVMLAGLVAWRAASAGFSPIVSLVSGCAIGAVLYSMVCMLVADCRSELRSLVGDVGGSFRARVVGAAD